MIKDEFYGQLKNTLGFSLTPEQIAIIEAQNRYVSVLATAGSGKTTTIAIKIGYAIYVLGVRADDLLALSFSKASALDFKSRFSELFEGLALKSIRFSTLHAFALSILRQVYKQKDITIKLVDDATVDFNKYTYLAQVYYQHLKIHPTKETLDDLFNEFSYVKNSLIDSCDYKPIHTGFMPCFKAYEAIKEQRHLIDYDDMLIESLRALQENPVLKEQITSRFKYIYLDEAQDVNHVQIELLNLLTENAHQYVLIGDDDQAIYGFRGADPNYLIDFSNHRDSVQTYSLGTNYRCPESIVSCTSKFICENTRRLNKEISAAHRKANSIQLVGYTSLKEASRLLKNDLLEFKQRYKESPLALLSDVALLCRNSYAMLIALESLKEANIPVYVRDDNFGFFNHWIVRDIQLFSDVLARPSDLSCLLKFLPRVKIYIAKKHHAELLRCPSKESFFNHLEQIAYKGSKKDIKLLRHILTFGKQETAKNQLETLYEQLNYKEVILERAARGGYAAAMPLTIWETLTWFCEGYGSVGEFMEALMTLGSLYSSLKQTKRGQGISLLTLHASKGLEFKHVLMFDLQKGILPSMGALEDQRTLEEERRLFYVGATRAKESLRLYYPIDRPSPFIRYFHPD